MNEKFTANQDEEFWSITKAAKYAQSTADSFRVYLCNTGSKSGKSRPRFPSHIYTKFGRKTLFIKSRFIQWLLDGAKMLQPKEIKEK